LIIIRAKHDLRPRNGGSKLVRMYELGKKIKGDSNLSTKKYIDRKKGIYKLRH